MVRGDCINECRGCGHELIGRDEIEAIVKGESRLRYTRDIMHWQSYSSLNSFMYSKFDGVSGSGGVTKNIVCGCNVRKDASPSIMMIRDAYRDAVRTRFGDSLSLPFLFRLPPAMVAWENCAFVKAQETDDGLMMSDDGIELVDIIADMSHVGVFDGGMKLFTEHSVLTQFTYLHMVKPAYRSFVAMDFGPEAKLGDLTASVPNDWLDWSEMATLRVDGTADDLKLSRVAGVACAADMVEQAKPPVITRDISTVVPGVAVTQSNTCVQLMPAENNNGSILDLPVVVLGSGPSFLPAGRVLLHANCQAVTFDVGTTLRTLEGTDIVANQGAVTLFLDGTVEVELSARDDASLWDWRTREHAAYEIAVVCDSFAHDTPLGRWYKHRIDNDTVRYLVDAAELILLSYASVYRHGPHWPGRTRTLNAMDDAVVVEQYHRRAMSVDDVYTLPDDVMVVRCSEVQNVSKCMRINEAVILTPTSRVGLLGSALCDFVDPMRHSATNWLRDQRMAVTFQTVTSTGRWQDDETDDELPLALAMRTHVASKVVEIAMLRYAGQPLPSYVAIAKHADSLAAHLGVMPTLYALLRTPRVLIDRDKLLTTGFVRDKSTWCITTAQSYTITWKDLLRWATSWCDDLWPSHTLFTELLELYPDVPNIDLHAKQFCR